MGVSPFDVSLPILTQTLWCYWKPCAKLNRYLKCYVPDQVVLVFDLAFSLLSVYRMRCQEEKIPQLRYPTETIFQIFDEVTSGVAYICSITNRFGKLGTLPSFVHFHNYPDLPTTHFMARESGFCWDAVERITFQEKEGKRGNKSAIGLHLRQTLSSHILFKYGGTALSAPYSWIQIVIESFPHFSFVLNESW